MQAHCPCRSTAQWNMSTHDSFTRMSREQYTLCVIRNAPAMSLMSANIAERSPIINFRYINETELLANGSLSNDAMLKHRCKVLVKVLPTPAVLPAAPPEHMCPGVCLPIPYHEVVVDALRPALGRGGALLVANLSAAGGLALTCTLTQAAVFASLGINFDSYQDSAATSTWLPLAFFRAIARRRHEECAERGKWLPGSFSVADPHSLKNANWSADTYHLHPEKSLFPRRKVYGLILWIGSNDRYNMLRSQMESVRLQHARSPRWADEERIFGWAATEDVYPCKVYDAAVDGPAPQCKHGYAFHWMMPSGKMRTEGTTGWGCAQRRMLRAMAHTLLLFDPDFLLVVDDDTYVNVPQLTHGTNLSRYMTHEMRQAPLALGHLTGSNKVTNHGFFYGGGGYLMGRGVLDKLVNYTFTGPMVWADSIRNSKHMDHLGLMEEAHAQAARTCPNDCLLMDRPYNSSPHGKLNRATTPVRLVDVCTNLLSEEGTCYHSDHAMSRCLVHGVYAIVFNAHCWGLKLKSSGSLPSDPAGDPPKTELELRMCHGVDKCLDMHLTCHRWMPNVTDPALLPMAASDKYFIDK